MSLIVGPGPCTTHNRIKGDSARYTCGPRQTASGRPNERWGLEYAPGFVSAEIEFGAWRPT